MIWFGKLENLIVSDVPESFGFLSESVRMRRALERVAEVPPQLSGSALIDALEATGWVDRPTAERLLPTFIHFDPDRHFGEYMRRLSFRGRPAADEFRRGVRHVVEELVGSGKEGEVGPEKGIRFECGTYEGLVLAYPEVSFGIAGPTRSAIEAAVEEMPDALVLVAKNFDPHAADQLSTLLSKTGVPGTLMTVNLLLGIRAITLRYQPSLDRLVSVLATGRPLRSADIAKLGDR